MWCVDIWVDTRKREGMKKRYLRTSIQIALTTYFIISLAYLVIVNNLTLARMPIFVSMLIAFAIVGKWGK